MIPSMSHRLFQESEFSPCRKHDRCLLLCLKARKRLHVATVLKEQIFQIGGILQSTCKHLRQVILPLCRHLSFQMRKYPYRKGKQKSVIFAVIGLCGYSVSYVCSDDVRTPFESAPDDADFDALRQVLISDSTCEIVDIPEKPCQVNLLGGMRQIA